MLGFGYASTQPCIMNPMMYLRDLVYPVASRHLAWGALQAERLDAVPSLGRSNPRRRLLQQPLILNERSDSIFGPACRQPVFTRLIS